MSKTYTAQIETNIERIRLALKRRCNYRDIAASFEIIPQTDESYRVTSADVALGIDFNATIESGDTLRLWIPEWGTFAMIPYRFRAGR